MSNVVCMFMLIAQEFTIGELQTEKVKSVRPLMSSFSTSFYSPAR
jgi:hypothetical protein